MASVSIPVVRVVVLLLAQIVAGTAVTSVSPKISEACQASQFPEECTSWLMSTPVATNGGGAVEIVKAAMELSFDGVKESHARTESILATAISFHNFNMTVAARNCLESLDASMRTISKSSSANMPKRVKDARVWMSAALSYQYGCLSGISRLNRSDLSSTAQHMNSSIRLTSNALSMVAAVDVYGLHMKSWRPPQTERTADFSGNIAGSVDDDEWLSFLQGKHKHRRMVANVTVSKEDKTAQYSSIQAAVDAAPNNSSQVFVIHIAAGVYNEIVRVPPSKTNLMWVGDGMDRTIITGSLNAQQPGVGTYGSATVGINADGFVARDMTFENRAGPEMNQAVALRVDSDLSVFQRCAILGHQDSLYAHTLRQLYVDCRVEGTVDFIFGDAAAVFRNTTILVRPRALSATVGESSPVTAHGRFDPGESTGFVFQNCIINGTEEYMQYFYANPEIHRAYLGRPWKSYSRTVFIRSYLGGLIRPEGWAPWDGTFALDTLFYGEFENYGPGSNVSARVPWSAQISPRSVRMYSLRDFIQGHQWLPFLLSNYLND